MCDEEIRPAGDISCYGVSLCSILISISEGGAARRSPSIPRDEIGSNGREDSENHRYESPALQKLEYVFKKVGYMNEWAEW
jgi:hypothetical protein